MNTIIREAKLFLPTFILVNIVGLHPLLSQSTNPDVFLLRPLTLQTVEKHIALSGTQKKKLEQASAENFREVLHHTLKDSELGMLYDSLTAPIDHFWHESLAQILKTFQDQPLPLEVLKVWVVMYANIQREEIIEQLAGKYEASSLDQLLKLLLRKTLLLT